MSKRLLTRCFFIGIALHLYVFGAIGGQVNGGYQEFIANSGTTVTLQCYGTHSTYDNITWWKNDSVSYVAKRGAGFKYFSEAFNNRLNFVDNTKNLMIFDCQGKDHGFYYCETVYGSEKRRGGHYRFIVEEKPKCQRIVSELNVLVGATVDLPCLVQGTPKPTYKWTKQVNNEVISLGSRFGASRKGLHIKDVKLEDRGTYKVKLKNKIDTYYHSIQLNVKKIESILKENYYSVHLDSDVAIECGKGPLKEGTSVSWSTSDGNDAAALDRFKAKLDGSIAISTVQLSDVGLYTCKKRVPFGGGILTQSMSVYINVQYRPVNTEMKKVIEVYNNTHAIIPCEARGNPAPMYRWSFPDSTTISSNKKHEFYSNGSLIIRHIRLTDVLNYTCTPYNKVGDGEPGHTKVFVLVPPRFLHHWSEAMRVRVGDVNINLNCSVFGIPTPSLSWQFIDKYNKRHVLLSRDDRKITSHKGLYSIDKIKRSDQGTYICTAKSRAGLTQRQIQLIVLDKPQVPKEFSVVTKNKTMQFSWQPGYDGGAKQDYELWFRSTDKTDFEWITVNVSTLKIKHNVHLRDTDSPGRDGISFYCSIRAKNSEGYSDFSYIVKTAKLIEGNKEIPGRLLSSPLSTTPLSPGAFGLIIYKNRYELKWKYVMTPGRPASKYFLVEYREKNLTAEWKAYAREGRLRRSAGSQDKSQNNLNIYADDIPGVTHPLKFRVSTVSALGVKSKAATPIVTDLSVTAVTGRTAAGIDTNLIPPIVMGVIFSLFTILIIIGLYCYCERKKKRLTSNKESKASLVPNDNNNTTIDRNSLELRDNLNLLTGENKDMPTRYHFSHCPALKLGESSHPTDSSQPDDVFVLLQPNSGERAACTCSKKYVTQEQLKLNDKKRSLYKSSSLPSVLFTSDADISSVDPSVDGRDFSVSDNKKDGSHTLDKDAISRLQRGGLFRDSYDKFCRSGSNSKSPSRAPSTTLPGAEKRSLTQLPETDTSSTATPVVQNGNILRHVGVGVGMLDDDESPETKSNKSIDGKSSGFGDGDSSTSDPDSIELDRFVHEPPQHQDAAAQLLLASITKKDTGYFSDVPTRISPLFINNQKFHPLSQHRLNNTKSAHAGYFSEDETATRQPYRPLPPSYNQAIIDIERMTDECPGITDSEVMCNKLIEMQKQMGIKLDDSIENNLDKITMAPPPPPPTLSRFQNPFLDSGYMSDVSSTLKTRYSNKEKNERCAQLLNEFKIYRKPVSPVDFTEGILEEDLPPPGSTPKHIVGRSISAMEDHILEEHEPQLKRSNSTNSNLFNEWLV